MTDVLNLDPVSDTARAEAFLLEISVIARGYGYTIQGGKLVASDHALTAVLADDGHIVWQTRA